MYMYVHFLLIEWNLDYPVVKVTGNLVNWASLGHQFVIIAFPTGIDRDYMLILSTRNGVYVVEVYHESAYA